MALDSTHPLIVPSALAAALGVALTAGCGDDAVDSASNSGTESATEVSATVPTSLGSDSESSTGMPTTTPTGSDSDSSASDSTTEDPTKFDVGLMPDIGQGACSGMGVCGETDWSYVWIANSAENTISKIDTRDVVEVGRYYTRPDQSGNPSRTSVSIDAKAVAVANRSGGITKIWARPEFCTDKNNDGMINTSTGKNDVLPFTDEECIAWHTPFQTATTQRPIAWTSGVYNEQTCEYEDQQIWTAAAHGNGGTWPCDGADGIYVYLLNGDDGTIDEEIHMPEVACGGTFGPYGAAVDFENNVWMYIWSAGKVLNVNFETLEYQVINGGAYGITVDSLGRPWVGDSPRRLNLDTLQWESYIGDMPGAGGAGIAEDHMGRMWTATQGGVGWVDRDTLIAGDKVLLPEGSLYRGVGVDVDGFVWAVGLGGQTAHKINPETYEFETYTGLNSPYTYSDMAGGQINNVACNPPNG